MIDYEKTRPIGIFDSGIGGISVLQRAVEMLPNEDFIFYGDRANIPYGEKTHDQIRRLTCSAVDYLISRHVKAVIVACNTATSAAIQTLRGQYDFPIVGMEPAIKPALEQVNREHILVMATPATLRLEKFQNLKLQLGQENRLIELECPGLAAVIENSARDEQPVDVYLRELFAPYLDKSIGAVVLGCTHYHFIADKIHSYFPGAAFFDGIDGTVNRMMNLLDQTDLLNDSTQKPSIAFYSSDGSDQSVHDFIWFFNKKVEL